MKKKGLLGIVAIFMAIALALTGCGQQGKQNAGATGSESQNGTTAADDGKNEGEVTTEPDGSDDVGGEADNRNPEMRDGYYVYEVDGVELLCETNIWDYIDGDVWHRTEMFEDLGYERDDSIEVASRFPGFFRYVGDKRLTVLVGSPMNKNSEDFIELQYLNRLDFYVGSEAFDVIVRCQQDSFATDEVDGPRTPIDIIVTAAYFLEKCQDDIKESYLGDVFPNAVRGNLRIYQQNLEKISEASTRSPYFFMPLYRSAFRVEKIEWFIRNIAFAIDIVIIFNL